MRADPPAAAAETGTGAADVVLHRCMACLRIFPAALAALLVLPAGAGAQDVPDWLPAAIDLPSGHEIVRETEVGSTNRLMLVEIAGDPSDLLAAWRAGLEAEGYVIDTTSGETLQDQIVFSGMGIRTGQVVVMPGTTEDVSLIQIDATLDR